jgi:hypothetical protein
VLLEAGVERQLEAALELGDPCRHLELRLGRAHVVQRVDDDLGLAEALGELQRSLAPGACSRLVAREHAQLRHVAVGHGELAAGLEALEQLDRLPRLVLGRGVVALKPGQAREPAVRVALAAEVAGRTVLVQRLLAGLDGARDVVGQVALVGAALEQVGPAIGRQPCAMAQGAGELGGRLAVGPEHGRTLAGGRGVALHGLGVAGRLGVVGQAGGVRARARGERGERAAVQRQAPVRARAPPRRRLARSRGGSSPASRSARSTPDARHASRPSSSPSRAPTAATARRASARWPPRRAPCGPARPGARRARARRRGRSRGAQRPAAASTSVT